MKLRPFVLGLLVGAILASSVAAAASNQVEAFLKDEFELYIDGQEINLVQEGYHTLFYDNRVYTPVRPIAEKLGASIYGDADMAAITKPAPTPRPTPTPTPDPDATPTPTPTPERTATPATTSPSPTPNRGNYNPYPVHMTRSNVEINVSDMSTDGRNTTLLVDYYNETDYPIIVNFDESYITVDGEKFPCSRADNEEWWNSFDPFSEGEYLDLVFRGDADDEKLVSLHLVMTSLKSLYGSSDDSVTFNMDIDFSDDD